MGNKKKEKERIKIGYDDEKAIINAFRLSSSRCIRFNGRFFSCWRIKTLIRSFLFSKSWIDSSSESDLPPDFHNYRHRIMMEVMRIDDGVGGKKSPNSYERTVKLLKLYGGANYKEKFQNASVYITPNTENDSEYNFKGYFKNFVRVLTNHSNKVDDYRKNYPKCKTCVLFIFDESNIYYDSETMKAHNCFDDKKFIEIIKKCNADYVVWFAIYKIILDSKNKTIKIPNICIYDVKHLKNDGLNYNHDKMIKIKQTPA